MRTLPHRSISAILPLCLIAVMLAGAPALAQTATAPAGGAAGPNWIVNCSNQADPGALTCAMSQTILQTQSRQRIVSATVLKDGDGWTMVLSLPHGLDLPSGVTVAVDEGAATPHPFQTADTNGAYARIPLSPEMIAAMKAGGALKVGVVSAAKQNANLELSLAGFSTSLALMDR